MADFKLHDQTSAPEESKPLLQDSEKSFGMIPNLHAVMAEAPGLLKAYQTTHELFANSSFDENELTVVWQTINVYHSCHYCVPAHTAIAKQMGADDSITRQLKNGETLDDSKLQALRIFTEAVLEKRGQVEETDVRPFFDAGYGNRHVLEVILGIAQKTMSNYTNAIAQTPIDEPFQKFK
ncbi:carboxymuconolactone decarboxylase [Idiomarina sp. OT37-5b]|uniref:Carboxymuconolactone decarboxylase n=1 Tax=Idiomarina aquatica TaxID=1327752 RepID=A0AA94EGJ9_9GAMM|nr:MULTISPECIES: carboxymuconolactone decarboxylase family protein [Idiomarina]AVJ55325.1 carboxymuconolactone decarboxylase [Idiomarina sp. OT37-5b]RUO45101.1 carboxymuconolactone decarboxylase [Idiomarina aquatica]